MSRFRVNVVANLLGQGWSALLQLLVTPVYIRLLGIEAYGLIGFFVVLQTTAQVFDLGLAQTTNRELARLSADPERFKIARDLVRTFEVVYWVLGLLIAGVLLLAAPIMAAGLFRPGSLTVETITEAIRLMAIAFALQWPLGLYSGGMMGLQKQPTMNALRVVVSTLTAGGAVLVLWLATPSIRTFMMWQIVAGTLAVALVARFLWRSLPTTDLQPRFRPDLLRQVWRFAAGMTGLTISAVVLTQLDKWILVQVLSLETFGYFTLAVTFANALYLFVTPIFSAVYPRFSVLVAKGDEAVLKRLYHLASQLMAVAIVPTAVTLSLFSYDILLLWTRSEVVANAASPIASILVIGSALNGLMNLPYALQLANGWTSLGLAINVVLTVILAPTIWFMATHYGAIGAALVWIVLNGSYMAAGIPLTHTRLLKGEGARWVRRDVAPPVLAAVVSIAVLAWLLPVGRTSGVQQALLIGAVLACGMIAAATAAPEVRTWLRMDFARRLAR
ncbi:MAG: oligosaccharide flippase family protein [Burkholderiales bacterium]